MNDVGGVWYRARAELRQRRRAIAALALVAGMAGGLVIGAADGARRTDTAVDRFVRGSGGAGDATVVDVAPDDLAAIDRLPQLRRRIAFFFAFLVSQEKSSLRADSL